MIPEERIMDTLNSLLGDAEPGAATHYLHVLAVPAGAVGPFGTVDPKQLQLTISAIIFHKDDSSDTAEDFVARTIMGAAVDHGVKGLTVVFAAISMEMCRVPRMDDLARRLLAQGRLLTEHPNCTEATIVYGACRDGRRWKSRRWVSGPRAGQTDDPLLLVGEPSAHESALPVAPLMRRLVGLR